MVGLCVASCKKDDESTTLPALDGHMSFSVPAFVKPETRIIMTPHGVEHPDGEGIGYYWKVTPTMTKNDTTRYENGLDKFGQPSDGSFTHTFSDTLQTYTVYGYAFAEGYSAKSAEASCTVVSGGINESITDLGLSEQTPSVTIDGKTYYYTSVGTTDWMVQNIGTDTDGAPYYNCKAMSDVFGRYYSYEEALTVCPEGWTLPSEEDWIALAKAAGAEGEIDQYSNISGIAAAIMGNASFNGTRLWDYWPEVGDITNKTGMSIIPAGYAMLGEKNSSPKVDENYDYIYPNAIFKGYMEYAAFWTADPVDDEEGMAYYRYLIATQPDLMIGKADTQSFGASVRCIRKK
jgi:uncharacterized protein (TIGR02145 family)